MRGMKNPGWRYTCCCFFFLAGLTVGVSPAAHSGEELLRNVGLVVVPREILFYSADGGQWVSIRLDAGERVLQRGADGNVAVVVTSQRAIGFSAPFAVAQEFTLVEEETLETFKVEGNMATVVTRRRAYGFSGLTGKWSAIDRFQLGK